MELTLCVALTTIVSPLACKKGSVIPLNSFGNIMLSWWSNPMPLEEFWEVGTHAHIQMRKWHTGVCSTISMFNWKYHTSTAWPPVKRCQRLESSGEVICTRRACDSVRFHEALPGPCPGGHRRWPTKMQEVNNFGWIRITQNWTRIQNKARTFRSFRSATKRSNLRCDNRSPTCCTDNAPRPVSNIACIAGPYVVKSTMTRWPRVKLRIWIREWRSAHNENRSKDGSLHQQKSTYMYHCNWLSPCLLRVQTLQIFQ